jgi:CBS domain-containing protein
MTDIGPYIHRKIVVLPAEDTAQQAARAMAENGIGCVLVTDHQGHFTGILTDRDIACRIVAHGLSAETPLSQVMTPHPVTVGVQSRVSQVIRLMEDHGIRRIPVVRDEYAGRQRCIGMICLDDLIGSRDIDEYHLMRIVRSQIQGRLQRTAEFRSWTELNEPGQSPVPRSVEGLFEAIRLATGLPEGSARALIGTLSSSLVRRLHRTAAGHLISALPAEFRTELLAIRPGPDPRVRLSELEATLAEQFTVSEAEAHQLLIDGARALDEWLGHGAWDHVKAQLPEDYRAVFLPTPSSQAAS